jgi:hypothetical protein
MCEKLLKPIIFCGELVKIAFFVEKIQILELHLFWRKGVLPPCQTKKSPVLGPTRSHTGRSAPTCCACDCVTAWLQAAADGRDNRTSGSVRAVGWPVLQCSSAPCDPPAPCTGGGPVLIRKLEKGRESRRRRGASSSPTIENWKSKLDNLFNKKL